MIPKWQMAGIVVLVLMLAAFAIYTSPNSYAHVYLSGACNRTPPPTACNRLSARPMSGLKSYKPAW